MISLFKKWPRRNRRGKNSSGKRLARKKRQEKDLAGKRFAREKNSCGKIIGEKTGGESTGHCKLGLKYDTWYVKVIHEQEDSAAEGDGRTVMGLALVWSDKDDNIFNCGDGEALIHWLALHLTSMLCEG